MFNKKPKDEYNIEAQSKKEETALSFGKAVQAWCPFILIFVK